MQIFKNRPLAGFACSLAFCALLAHILGKDLKFQVILWIGIASVCALLLSIVWRHVGRLLPLLLGALLAFSSSYLYFDRYLAQCREMVGEELLVEGVVIHRADATEFASSFGVRLERIGEEASGEKVILSCEYPSALQIGDAFVATVTQREFTKGARFDELRYYNADGYTRILACESAEACTITEHGKGGLTVLLKKWNSMLSARMSETIGREEGALVSAVLLGNREGLSNETQMHFRRTGVSHLLALSGMHVSILIGALELLLRRLRVGKLIRAGIMPVVLIAYLALTGFSPSAVRAVLMVCVLYLGFLLRADYDSLTALSAVLSGMLILTPYAVADLSMWMSYLAAASIIVFYPWIAKMGGVIEGKKHTSFHWARKIVAKVFEAFLIGSVATAALLWLSAEAFGGMSVLAIPATLLFSLPLAALLILSILLLLFPYLPIVAAPCRILARWMLEAARSLSNLSDIDLAVGSNLETVLLILLSALLVTLAVGKWKHASFLLLVPLLTATVYGASILMTDLSDRSYLSAEASGCGFAMLSEEGELIAVDFNASDSADAVRLTDLARENRCTELDELILTDYDNRRVYVLSCIAERMPVRCLRLRPVQNDYERAVAARIEEVATLYGIEVRYDLFGIPPSLGDPYKWELYPPTAE